jgi:hypothetical protein
MIKEASSPTSINASYANQAKKMPSRPRASVLVSVATIALLLFVSDKRLHVVKFLAPAMGFIGMMIAFAYYMEARNWSVGPLRRFRRESSETESA